MEKVTDIKSVIAENLTRYRKAANMTQQELANALNYSDKSISKWERGEAVPDIYILKAIADLYNVTVNDFLVDSPKKIVLKNPFKNKNRILIVAMSTFLVWFIAVFVAVVLSFLDIKNFRIYNLFIYSIPISMVVLIVFNGIWFKLKYLEEICVSVLSWTILLSIFLTFNTLVDQLAKIFFIGVPFQVLIILWYLMSKRKK